jgi:hypothetical protein
VNTTPVHRNPSSPSEAALGPRPTTADPLVAAATKASLGARLELERSRRRELRHQDEGRLEALERDVERVIAELARIAA